jgi:hypothetical protein
VIVRDLVVSDFVHPRLAIHHRAGAAADWNADPVLGLPLPAVEQRKVVPAAVLGPEVVGEIGQVHQFRGIDMRIGAEADHDVRAGAGVGDHGELRTQVLPAHEVHLHIHASGLDELLGVRLPEHLVRIDELGRPQHVQGRALFDREFGRLHVRRRNVVNRRSCPDDRDRRRPQRSRAKGQGITPRDGHLVVSSIPGRLRPGPLRPGSQRSDRRYIPPRRVSRKAAGRLNWQAAGRCRHRTDAPATGRG